MQPEEWIKKFADRVCTFYGEDYRSRAEKTARTYLDGGDIRDDPDAAAVLIMEGWATNADFTRFDAKDDGGPRHHHR